LQARGKVNIGIRRTILEEPERFLAYNNGISATASGIDFVTLPSGGVGISVVHDLQIVNGGQTTASIHHVAKRDRDRARVDLSKLFVQAKLTVVPASKLDEIVHSFPGTRTVRTRLTRPTLRRTRLTTLRLRTTHDECGHRQKPVSRE